MDDGDFDQRLRLWAARELHVAPDAVVTVETDWEARCGFDTCEFSWGEIDVTLADGRRFHGENTFGLFLRDIVELSVNPDGSLNRRRENLFDLHPV